MSGSNSRRATNLLVLKVVLAGFLPRHLPRCKIAAAKKYSSFFLGFYRLLCFFFRKMVETITASVHQHDDRNIHRQTKREKKTGKAAYTIFRQWIARKCNAVSTIHQIVAADKRNKVVLRPPNNLQCENGIVMMDMKMFIPAAQQEQMGEMSAPVLTNHLRISFFL